MTRWCCCRARRVAIAIRTRRAKNWLRDAIPRASEATHAPDSSGHIAAGAETVDGTIVAGEIAEDEDGLIVAAAAIAEIVADIITVDTAVDITAGIIMAGTRHSGVHN